MPIVWENYLEQSELRMFENHIHEPAINVRVGLRCLSTLKKEFGDWRRALRAYVGGPKRADDAALNGYADSVLLKKASYEREIERVWNRRDRDRYAGQEEEKMETGKMKVEIGERFANCLTGRVYRVGMTNKEWVILESEDGSSQVLTGRVSLASPYSRPGDETLKSSPKRKGKTYP